MRIAEVVFASVLLGGCAHGNAISYDVARTITDPSLQAAQRAIWISWFAGDTAEVRRLTPALVAADGQGFADQEQAVRSSAEYHAGGGAPITQLSFRDVHVQRFGEAAIIYSIVEYTTGSGSSAKKHVQKATEIFVRDHGTWVNPGWHLENVPQG